VTNDLASLRTDCDRVAALAYGKVIGIAAKKDMRHSEHASLLARQGGHIVLGPTTKRGRYLKPLSSISVLRFLDNLAKRKRT
jgi:hypothetical protein